MAPLMQLISSLSEDEKIQLVYAISEKMLYPGINRGLRYYSLDRILEVEPEYESLTTDESKRLIKAIVNHI